MRPSPPKEGRDERAETPYVELGIFPQAFTKPCLRSFEAITYVMPDLIVPWVHGAEVHGPLEGRSLVSEHDAARAGSG